MFHFPQPPNIVHFYSRFVFNQELSMVLMLLLFVTSVEWLNKRRPLFLLSAVMPVTLMELGCLSCGTSRLWVPWWWSVLLFNAFSCPFPTCWKLELSLAPGSSLSFGEKELSQGCCANQIGSAHFLFSFFSIRSSLSSLTPLAIYRLGNPLCRSCRASHNLGFVDCMLCVWYTFPCISCTVVIRPQTSLTFKVVGVFLTRGRCGHFR